MFGEIVAEFAQFRRSRDEVDCLIAFNLRINFLLIPKLIFGSDYFSLVQILFDLLRGHLFKVVYKSEFL